MSGFAYVIIRQAVYRHDVLGIYLNEVEARGALVEATKLEGDSHHDLVLLKFVLGAYTAIWYHEAGERNGQYYYGSKKNPYEQSEEGARMNKADLP